MSIYLVVGIKTNNINQNRSKTFLPFEQKNQNKRIEPGFENSFKGDDFLKFLTKGDKALNENKFQEAIDYYNLANSINPDEAKIYKKIAKAQFGLKNYILAEENYVKYLDSNPNDVETLADLGETQRQRGYYYDALNTLKKAHVIDENHDLVNRRLMETKNNMLAIFSPERAKKEKEEYAAQNLQTAIDITVDYMTPKYMSELHGVNIRFGETASMGGTGNIAQYEHNKHAITISDLYIYATPQVISAYLIHESVHAHDNDPYTSIREEQDAYQAAAKFWMENSREVKDPEMDYAVELYKKSPYDLNKRVEEIYKLRDPSIAMTSPNHPPKKYFWMKNKKQEASQSIKAYDVIA